MFDDYTWFRILVTPESIELIEFQYHEEEDQYINTSDRYWLTEERYEGKAEALKAIADLLRVLQILRENEEKMTRCLGSQKILTVINKMGIV